MLPTIHVLVKDAMYVSRGEIPMYVGDAEYQWIYEDSGLTSQYDQLAGVLAWMHQIFSAKLLTPKDGSSFILASLTSRSHQVNYRILLVPCFTVVVYNETWWPLLNVHLNYKPTNYWRILFWSGGRPMQFSCLKKFRALVVPGGGMS